MSGMDPALAERNRQADLLRSVTALGMARDRLREAAKYAHSSGQVGLHRELVKLIAAPLDDIVDMGDALWAEHVRDER